MNLNIKFGILSSMDDKIHTSESKTIFNTVNRMIDSGLVSAGSGHCISMCDIIKSQLSLQNIESKIVEVSLTIGYFESQPPTFKHIGFDGLKAKNSEIDTHVVLVTSTNPPILIDASISHILPYGKLALIEKLPVNSIIDNEDICFDHSSHKIKFVYKEKKNQKVPLTHQISIIERINTDKKIFDNLKFLKVLIILALVISFLNASRGLYDFYQVYFNNNFWGPSSNEKIINKIETIEELLIQKQNQ